MRVLWLSRHPMLDVQRAALRARWPGVEIIEDHRWRQALTGPVQPVIERMRAERIDEVAMVAPLSVVQRFVEAGAHPLWAEMVPVAALNDLLAKDVEASTRKAMETGADPTIVARQVRQTWALRLGPHARVI